MSSTELNPGSGGDKYLNDTIGTEVVSLGKLITGAAGVNGGPVTTTNPYPVAEPHATTAATPVRKTSSTTEQRLIAAGARKGVVLFNDSTSYCYVLLGSGTADTTSAWTFKVRPGWGRLVTGYDGEIRGVWATANGGMQVTELT